MSAKNQPALSEALVARAVRRLNQASRLRPRLAIVLGTGFGALASELTAVQEIAYRRLPGFPVPTVPGHAGKIFLGFLGKLPVCLLSGRLHYYEGYSMSQVTFPVRVLAGFGVRDLLLTNAAGGIKRGMRPGDFMCLTDHINLMGANPLRGPVAAGAGAGAGAGGERFVDLTCVYDPGLRRLLRKAAAQARVKMHTGVYVAVSGPSYETPAEIRALGRLGGDAVGMSTVPEAIVARQCGLRVAGVSCLTNLAAGKSNAFLAHADVLAVGAAVMRRAAALLKQFAILCATEGRSAADATADPAK
ncbi:MAG TPA: purine-nucleoside phosphorylase [Verrucomicrobiae bacterium]|nr:purine-nucleoside phosphorylase [Verrucomicrobiae bacterium]